MDCLFIIFNNNIQGELYWHCLFTFSSDFRYISKGFIVVKKNDRSIWPLEEDDSINQRNIQLVGPGSAFHYIRCDTKITILLFLKRNISLVFISLILLIQWFIAMSARIRMQQLYSKYILREDQAQHLYVMGVEILWHG